MTKIIKNSQSVKVDANKTKSINIKDDKLLVRMYESCKQELRDAANLEKTVCGYLAAKEQSADHDKIEKYGKILRNRGFTDLDNDEAIKNDFNRISKRLGMALIRSAKRRILKGYEVDYCIGEGHYEYEFLHMRDPGYYHLLLKKKNGDRLCISPYGYVYRRGEIFGRILKDGRIRTVKFVQGGNIKLDSA